MKFQASGFSLCYNHTQKEVRTLANYYNTNTLPEEGGGALTFISDFGQLTKAEIENKNHIPTIADDKAYLSGYMADMFTNRIMALFKFGNCPEHIEPEMIVLNLITNGHIGWIEHEGKLWPLKGGFSTGKNAKYPTTPQGRPTGYIITNEPLKIGGEMYDVGDNVIVMRLNTLGLSLIPLIRKYAYLLTENEISMYNVDVLMRALFIIITRNDNDAKAAEAFICKLITGQPAFMSAQDFAEQLEVSPGAGTGSQNSLKALIEYHQYKKAEFFAELGINANWNGKREAINESEAALNEYALLPFIDNVRDTITAALDEVNEKFAHLLPNGPITFELGSAWNVLDKEVKIALETAENEADAAAGESEMGDAGDLADDEAAESGASVGDGDDNDAADPGPGAVHETREEDDKRTD